MPFDGTGDLPTPIPFAFVDYLELKELSDTHLLKLQDTHFLAALPAIPVPSSSHHAPS